MLDRVATAIGGGDIGAVDLIESTRDRIVQDITITSRDNCRPALPNTLRIVKKPLRSSRVVVTRGGAAGTATIRSRGRSGVRDITGVDERGTLRRGRVEGYGFHEAMGGSSHPSQADQRGLPAGVHRPTSSSGCRSRVTRRSETLKRIARDPIVFALINPAPEIHPKEAERHVRVIATGRSDDPDRINNKTVALAEGVARTAWQTGAARQRRRFEVSLLA